MSQAAVSECSQDSGSITTNRATLVEHRASFRSNLSDTDVMFLNVSRSLVYALSVQLFALICFLHYFILLLKLKHILLLVGARILYDV